MTLQVRASDSFSRIAGLNGSTLNNALGGIESVPWAVQDGSGWNTTTVGGDQCDNSDVTGTAVATVTTTARAEMYVHGLLAHNDCGIIGRWTTGSHAYGQFYMCYRDGGNHAAIGRFINSGYTALHTESGTISDSDDVGLLFDAADGITLMINGSAVFAVTDSNIATGVPGLYGGGSGLSVFKNFVYETVLVPTSSTAKAISCLC